MRKNPNQLPVEALLENSHWVRHLALSLLRDRSLVDDVVQEVWTRAVERPPDKPQALPLWLKKVVRSVAFRANRVMMLRHRAESHQRAKVETSPGEIAEQLEVQRLLTELVLELDEPYRTVVYLHYFGGKKLTEIADELDVPSSTVRTRLSRALLQLRGRLITRHGDRQWRSALLPLALGSPGAAGLRRLVEQELLPAPGAPASTAGRAEVRPRVSIPLRPGPAWLALVPAAILVVWLATEARDERTGAERDSPAAARTAWRAEGIAGAAGAAIATAGPGEAVNPATSPASRARAMGPASLPAASAPVRVLDAVTGDAVANAAVYFVQLTRLEGIPAGTTDARGLALVPRELLRRDALAVVAPGYVEHREAATLRDIEGPAHVVEIQPVFTASVRVLLPDGAAAAGVPVAIESPAAEEVDVQEVFTDGNGVASYLYQHPSTTIRIDLRNYVTVSRRASTPETRIDLRPGRLVQGLVLDADGNPLSRCRVEIETGSASVPIRAQSGPDGSFALGCLEDEEIAVTLHHTDWPSYRELGRPPASGAWTFRLPRGDHLVGYVETPDGASLEGAFAFVLTPEARPDTRERGVVSKLRTVPVPEKGRAASRLKTLLRSGFDARGRFELGPVTETEPEQYLWIYHPGLVNHFERLEPGTFEQGRTIRLLAGQTISGRLIGPTGDPVAGALLHLGEIWSSDIEGIVGRARTRDDGSFEFVGVPPEVEETLAGPSRESREGEPVMRTGLFVAAFPPDELLALGELSIADSPVWHGFSVSPGDRDLRFFAATRSNGATLSIRLRNPDGVPIRGWTPVLVLDAAGSPHLGQLGRRGAEERFYSDHPLSPDALGALHVVVMAEGFRWRQVDLDDASPALTLEMTLAPIFPSSATLSLVSADGQPAPGREVLVGIPFGTEAPRALLSLGDTDATGAVAVGCLEPGAYRFYTPRAGPDRLGAGKAAAHDAGGVATRSTRGRWIELGTASIEPGGVTIHVISGNP